MTPAAPVDLRTDARVDPRGIGSVRPEFAWRLPVGSEPQVAYAVQVAPDDGGRADPTWDSGRVESPQPFGVPYAGAPLESGRGYRWRVRVWTDPGGEPGPWSEARFETGLLEDSRWQAEWISGPAPSGPDDVRTLYLRGTVQLPASVVRARAYVSALGWYRFLVNGADLTGPALVPRWTPFDEYVEYQAYDVTDALRTGTNVLGMVVGEGRFRGLNGVANRPAVYGDRLAGLVQLEVDLADGSSVTVGSDGSWAAGPGRILTSDPKLGERVDLRVPDEDWLTSPALPGRFAAAEVLAEERRLVAEEVGRVTDVGRVPAVSVSRAPSGAQVVDLGQNIAGVVRIRLRGPAGTTVSLVHSELLRPDGELDLGYLATEMTEPWQQRDEVVLDGGDTWWSPWFTVHGFRYVAVEGLPDPLDPADVEGVVLSTDMPWTGEFDCSDPRLTRLHANVGWSLRSNFVDTATDCPTRERSGWTGDIQVFGPTATTFVDAQAYLRRYLRNVAAEQLPDGRVPVVVPAEASRFSGGLEDLWAGMATSVGWGDVTVVLPWTLYRYYGDRAVLRRQYPSMTAWVDQLARRASDEQDAARGAVTGRPDVDRFVLDTGFHYGEWLRPGEDPISSVTDAHRHSPVIATAYLEHSARLLSGIAGLLGQDGDAERYGELADAVRTAWRAVFLAPDGRIGTDRQDDYVRALAFDLLEPVERPGAVARLVALVEEAGDHLGTGFLSTPMLLPALVDGGRADVAWRLLLQTTSPSWLYQVDHGATTVWETWEGRTATGEAEGSHNHYAFGTVARFLTEHVAGIAPAEPGFRVLDLRPLVGGGLTWARAAVQTPYGRAASSWRIDGDDVVLEVTVPPGTSARVDLGDDAAVTLQGGTHVLRRPVGPDPAGRASL